MTTSFRIAALTLAAGAALCMAHPAAAKDHGNGHGNSGHGHGVENSHANGHEVIVIRDDDRSRIHDFLSERRNCPPGLAKKHNGCLPPGQAKKHYVGEVLVVEHTRTIWQELADLISPPPAGYRYVRADNDVLLVDHGNRVIDIVDAD